MGPTALFHLGSDAGGLAPFCERYADSFNRWWNDLGQPHLDQETTKRLVEGLSTKAQLDDLQALAAKRDALLSASHPSQATRRTNAAFSNT